MRIKSGCRPAGERRHADREAAKVRTIGGVSRVFAMSTDVVMREKIEWCLRGVAG